MFGKVFFMRHGETEWNQLRKQQGQKGSPLNEKGHMQAKKLARIIKTLRVNFLFTSPLERAMQTANIVSQHTQLKPRVDSRLMECSFGVCEGLTRTDIDHQYPNLWANYERSKWTFRWPNGESYADVDERVRNFISDCLLSENNNTIGIIAHETTNKVLLGRLLDLSRQEIVRLRQPNNTIFYLEKNEQIQHINFTEKSPKWQTGLLYK